MAKKIVELASKRKVELKEMSIDDIDFCTDLIRLVSDDDGNQIVTGMAKSRTAWLRRGIKGGDFKNFSVDKSTGFVTDKVIKQLKENEKNELIQEIQEFQTLGE